MKISELKIEKKYISILAGGESARDLPEDDIIMIKNNTFSISINDYFVFAPDARFWYDFTVTEQLIHYYTTRYKNSILISRPKAFTEHQRVTFLYNLIDYWYNRETDGFEGDKTLLILLQIIEKYNPGKIILLWGVDCISPKRYTYKNGEIDIELRQNYIGMLNRVKEELQDRWGNAKNVYNCNLKADIKMQKIDYKKILK